MNKKCSNCLYFNGEESDKIQFCDEKETYVSENSYCLKWRKRYAI